MRQALAGFKQVIDAQALVMTFSDLFFVFGVIMLVVIPLVLFLRRCPRAARSRCIEPAMIPNTLLRGVLPVTAHSSAAASSARTTPVRRTSHRAPRPVRRSCAATRFETPSPSIHRQVVDGTARSGPERPR